MKKLPHLLFLPKNYHQDQITQWPLILFLHGAGERGNDLNSIKKYGIPKVTEQNPDFPFISVSPLCPAGNYWPYLVEDLKSLLDEVIVNHRVDLRRIYLTGLSMGGYGTWYLSMAYPDTFAALAPICGGGDPRRVHLIKHLPIWVFHGAKDTIVPLKESEKMVEALLKAGNKVKFTIYPEAGHDSWTDTYNNPALYEWLLQHPKEE